jgi:hypothetical protein
LGLKKKKCDVSNKADLIIVFSGWFGMIRGLMESGRGGRLLSLVKEEEERYEKLSSI